MAGRGTISRIPGIGNGSEREASIGGIAETWQRDGRASLGVRGLNRKWTERSNNWKLPSVNNRKHDKNISSEPRDRTGGDDLSSRAGRLGKLAVHAEPTAFVRLD